MNGIIVFSPALGNNTNRINIAKSNTLQNIEDEALDSIWEQMYPKIKLSNPKPTKERPPNKYKSPNRVHPKPFPFANKDEFRL